MSDTVIKSIVKNYRELEQTRFIVYSPKNSFHPELLDDWLEVIDAIFEVRLPYLLHVLSQYESMQAREKQGKAFIVGKRDATLSIFMDDDGNMKSEMVEISNIDEALDKIMNENPEMIDAAEKMKEKIVSPKVDDDDDEDFLDEPDVSFEPKSM